ncbi:MAG: benzylsuccinate synthase gamma subunit family protein [Proteobacteria bacterium]|nr:benzylsuccinate synthase gamma subunit family protein [Pseudomonadota bacterium]
MPICEECRSFFPIEESPQRGDCVQREVDPRQSYYTAQEIELSKDAGECSSFQKK